MKIGDGIWCFDEDIAKEELLKMKYKVEVGSFCTRLITRTIIVSAEDENEASSKAISEYWKREQ